MHRNNIEHDLCIVPSPFCALGNINHGNHLAGDESMGLELVRNVRKNNLKFYKTRYPNIPADFLFHQILAIRALKT